MTVVYAPKVPVCRRVVFVDGLARCGKSLTCRVLSHLKGGEHWQYQAAIEHMCYMVHVGSIDQTVAAPFVQFVTEEQTYNRMIGRFLNTRKEDTSCIFKCPDHGEYLRRAGSEGGAVAVDRFNDERRIPVYKLHNTLATAAFLFKALPWMQVVHVSRHPVDQVHEWFRRGWGVRELTDPLSFVPLVETVAGAVPWFAKDWEADYLASNPVERALESVLWLQDADEKGYARLSAAERSRIYRFCLERLVTDPDAVVGGIARLLDTEAHDEMGSMLAEEQCPRTWNPEDRRRMFEEIVRQAGPDKVKRLVAAGHRFEARWGLDRFEP